MTSRATGVIRVEGLADFQRELRKLDSKFPRELRQANIDAAELVADKARGRAQAQGSTAAHVAPSIKAAGEQRRSKITLGGPRFPMAFGAEFGGQGKPTTQQFKPFNGGEGYFLYPTVRATSEEFLDAYEDALDRLMRRAFPT